MAGLQADIKSCLEMLQMALFPDSSIDRIAHHVRHLEWVLFRLLAR
jgi:hypothetical protein